MATQSTPRNTERESIARNLTRNDRYGLLLAMLFVVVGLAAGLLLKGQSATDTWTYSSREAGIEVQYPAGWLVDEEGDYVVRIRDPRARPFKTQYLVTTLPAGGLTSIRNVLDTLTLQRTDQLSAYRVLGIDEISSVAGPTTEMNFSYVDTDPNPFVQRLPVVVLGVDIVILDGNRALVVTFMSDQNSFEEDFVSFQRFLASLTY